MRYFYIIHIFLFILINGCTGISREYYNSERDETFNFLNFKYFTWLPKDSSNINNSLFDNPIIERKLMAYSNKELEKLGYEENEKIPDFLLKFTFLIEKRNENITYPIYTNVPYPNQITYLPYNVNLPNGGSNYNPYYHYQSSPYNVNYYANNYPYNNGYGFPVGSIPAYPNGTIVPGFTATNIAGAGFQQIEIKEGIFIIDVYDNKTKQLIWKGWSSEFLSDPQTFEKRLPFEIQNIFNQFPGKQ